MSEAAFNATHLSNRWHATLWISIGLIALNLAIYAPVAGYDFVDFDDKEYVTDNPHLADGFSRRGLEWAWTTGYQANWHPLTWMSHMLDVRLFGFDPGAHHAVNVALHILSTLLLFGVLLSMTSAPGRSAFVAALFAAHPLHVESVAWIAERKDVLSTVFWMLTIWCYTLYVRDQRRSRFAMVVLCLGLGLLAKPMLVTLPFVLLLLDFWPLERVKFAPGQQAVWRQLVREKLPLLGIAAASSAVTFFAQRHWGTVQNLQAFPAGFRIANAANSYIAYVLKMLCPVRLAVYYPSHPLSPWTVIASAAAVTAISATVWLMAARLPYLLVGWCWYVGTLVPVIGLIQVGKQAMADRYSYVPIVGAFVIVAWGIWDLPIPRLRRYVPVAAALAIVGCAATARIQLGYWKNFYSLWTHALEVTEDNDVAENNLGAQFINQGKLDDAMVHLVQAVRINPQYATAHSNIGMVFLQQKRLEEAAAQFQETVRLTPSDATAQSNLGVVLSRTGRREEAILHFSEAVRLAPWFAQARNQMARVLIDLGRREEANRQVEEVLRLNPENTEARRIREKLEAQERF